MLLLLVSSFALVASDVSYLQDDEEYNSAPPAKPYAFSYTAGRYLGHADTQPTEVSDGSEVMRDQYPYIDPRQKMRTVQFAAEKLDFRPVRNDAPPSDHPHDTEAVAQAKNQHYYLYNTIEEDHETYPYFDELATSSRSQHNTKTVAPGAVVEKGAYVYPGATVMGGSVIKQGAIVYDGALVKGGSVVGPNSRVWNNAVVGSGTVLGNGVIMHRGAQVEDGSVLKDGAILYDRALVKGGAVVGVYAVMGRHAEVGSGAVMGTRARLRDGSKLGDGQVMADGEVR